ncbi:transcription factor HES-3 [Microcaecilia unicolor]|uniref:Transcription factor HES-3 n=1 Tax=Microcaecilia unicolor TaxID=1415580 RepID=A0A6P7ZVD7_9AMPH|nr:transcription factor HES-3 [Microcaecilia unicolor]
MGKEEEMFNVGKELSNSSCAMISKPLMEKKRRARINVSLEQLKTLLEKHYSQNIRKRKLEKADILELTVKYMKTLQNSIQGIPVLKSAEYQTGFRSCLNGVSQFLLRSEEASENLYFHLIQDLAQAVQGINGSSFRTTDSSLASAVLPHHRLPSNLAQEQKGLVQANSGNTIAYNQTPNTSEILSRSPSETTPNQMKRDYRSRSNVVLNCHTNPSAQNRAENLWRPW